MIITLAFANGFQSQVSQKVFSFWGHIRVQERQPQRAIIAEEIPLLKNDTLAAAIRGLPDVESVHVFATKYAILKSKDEIDGVMLKGVDQDYDFNAFKRFIREGRAPSLADSTYSREVMLSEYTARQLNLKVNDRVDVYFITTDSFGENNIRPNKLTIVGIYKTGIEEYDSKFALADIRMLQKYYDWESDEVGGYEIFLDDYEKIPELATRIHYLDEFPATWQTQTARDISPNIFDWLNMQDTTRNVLIGFMIVVAIINLVCCLIILVLERVRMVGILKSLGATDWTVQSIFLRHSALITLAGIFIGTALALGFLYLQQQTGFIKLKEEAYYLSEAAVKISWWEVAIICGGTLIVCFLILMIPSLLVRKIQPVRAIHFR